MPLSKHYGGHGAKVMRAMQARYGKKKGKQVFYATEQKRKSAARDNLARSMVKRKRRRGRRRQKR